MPKTISAFFIGRFGGIVVVALTEMFDLGLIGSIALSVTACTLCVLLVNHLYK